MTNRDDLTPPTPAGWQPAQLSRLRCAELNRSCRYAPDRRVTLTLTSKSSHPLEALRRTRTLIPCARKIAARRTSVVRFPRPRIRAISSDRFALVQMSASGGAKGPTKLSDHAFASCSGQRRQIHRRLLHVST